ncbi:hypothetical protein [Nonomuraea sp. NPDC048826]|uniref:hypothetical protein n=1 Tax=Nonomuraea sp. NPDC048826 TaxID=3364347 RepID=UPI00371E8825
MGYRLEAVLGGQVVLRSLAEPFAAARAVVLRCGVGMLPLTDELFDAVSERDGERQLGDVFWKFPAQGESLFGRWSRGGAVAYVEVDLFGGVGSQAAAVWEAGRRVMGPYLDESLTGPAHAWPVNAALARLGVRSEAGYGDLFAAVGLDCHRDTEEWVTHDGECCRR